MGSIRARAGRAIAIGIAAGLGVFLLATLLAWTSLASGNARLLAEVRAGFAEGSLRPDASWLFGDTGIGVHQFNDCLVLFQAADDRATRLERSISPLSVNVSQEGPCAQLAPLAAGRTPLAAPLFYHRYVHAQTSLARWLVPALGVARTREVYRLVLSLLLVGALAYPMIALARGRRRAVNAAFVVVALVFARWFGLESFGQSLGHAPADAVALGFLALIVRAAGERPLTRRAAVVAAATFGALTMAFELLTGGLPLGLAMVVGLVPLALADDRTRLGTTATAALAYTTAAVTCLAAKLALATAVFGRSILADTAGQLAFRTGLSHAANHDQPADGSTFFGHLWAGLDALAPGMHMLVAGMLVLAIVAGGWGYAQLRQGPSRSARDRAAALAASAIVPPLWLVVFWQHSSEHAWFMDRILAWPIAAGLALFTLAVVADRDPPARAAPDRPAA